MSRGRVPRQRWHCYSCAHVGLYPVSRTPRTCKHCGVRGDLVLQRQITAARRWHKRDRERKAGVDRRAREHLAERLAGLPPEPADGRERVHVDAYVLGRIPPTVPVWRVARRFAEEAIAVETWAAALRALVRHIPDAAAWRLVAGCYLAELGAMLALAYDERGRSGLARTFLHTYPWPLLPALRARLAEIGGDDD